MRPHLRQVRLPEPKRTGPVAKRARGEIFSPRSRGTAVYGPSASSSRRCSKLARCSCTIGYGAVLSAPSPRVAARPRRRGPRPWTAPMPPLHQSSCRLPAIVYDHLSQRARARARPSRGPRARSRASGLGTSASAQGFEIYKHFSYQTGERLAGVGVPE